MVSQKISSMLSGQLARIYRATEKKPTVFFRISISLWCPTPSHCLLQRNGSVLWTKTGLMLGFLLKVSQILKMGVGGGVMAAVLQAEALLRGVSSGGLKEKLQNLRWRQEIHFLYRLQHKRSVRNQNWKCWAWLAELAHLWISACYSILLTNMAPSKNETRRFQQFELKLWLEIFQIQASSLSLQTISSQ